jgi:hypothetical protein
VQEAFYVAVDNDHVRLVESLLSDHAVGQSDVDEALCRAVRNCQPIIVRLLLQHRALRDEKGGSGGALSGARGQRVPTNSVLLSQAVQDCALAHMLLDSGRVDKDDISPEALEVAIRAGFSSLVDRFVSDLQCCERLSSSFWGDKLPLKTVVVAAVEAGSDVVLTSVLGLLRFVTARAQLEPWTAVKVLFEGMMAATKAGRMDMLTWLLTHLQEVNSIIVHKDVLQSFRMSFRELLTAACRLGQARIADMLWTTLPPAVGVTEDQLWVEGVEKTFVGDLVSVGCRNGHAAVVEVVLTRGKHHPVFQMFLDQMLVSVVASGDLQLVEVLLRHGADPTWNFYTRPLELAVEIGLVDVLRVFLAHPKVEPAYSAALLDLAVRHDHAEVVELLLEHCRSYVDVGLYGKVLHVALSAGYSGVVRTLLSRPNVCVPEVSEDDVGLYSDPLFKCHSVIAGHRLVSDDDFVRMVKSELTSAQRLCLLKFAAGCGKPRMMKVMLCVMDLMDRVDRVDRAGLIPDGSLDEDLQLKCGSEETSRVWQQWRSV